MNTRLLLAPATATAVLAAMLTATTPATATTPGDDVETLDDAARAAYTYTYPLATMEVTRRQATNVPVPVPGRPAAPTNQPAPMTEVPDASFTGVVRPNVDTLYTSIFYDVSHQPLVVGIPDTGDRYHLVQVMDAWSNVEGSPGTRTLGDDVGAYEIALTGPGWQGTLPDGVVEVPVDTSTGWLLARTQLNGPDDVDAVAALQQQITAVPLSEHGTDYRPPVNTKLHPHWPGPQDQAAEYIAGLSAEEYWDLYYSARSHTQTRDGDDALLDELDDHGWTPTEPLDLDAMTPSERRTWEQAKPAAIDSFDDGVGGDPVEGWTTVRDGIGDFGTDYRTRAATAHSLFAANKPEDAVYSSSGTDADGDAYEAGTDYVLHLDADEVPDVDAFWSVTLYDENGYLVDNPADRYAVRGEQLHTNPDGSVDVHLRNESPGDGEEANWLPTPDDGGFTLVLRAYGPGESVLDGTWEMPGVERT